MYVLAVHLEAYFGNQFMADFKESIKFLVSLAKSANFMVSLRKAFGG